jgi:hypothetical protein
MSPDGHVRPGFESALGGFCSFDELRGMVGSRIYALEDSSGSEDLDDEPVPLLIDHEGHDWQIRVDRQLQSNATEQINTGRYEIPNKQWSYIISSNLLTIRWTRLGRMAG